MDAWEDAAALGFQRGDRLLFLAPHPDDETLAAGIVLQRAHAAGAALRIVFATRGDNNPWPQRWLERRWRLGTEARARWGRRRSAEALAALGRLGIVDAAGTCFLDWPDLGLTERLMASPDAVEALVAELVAFAPTHVFAPLAGDAHPDHSALRVMLELALRRGGGAPRVFGYAIHGLAAAIAPAVVDAALQRRKELAVLEYASQLALSRGRMLAWCRRPERFEPWQPCEGAMAGSQGLPLRLPRPPWRWRWRRHELLLLVARADATERLRLPLPRLGWRGQVLAEASGLRLCLEPGGLRVDVVRGDASGLALWGKLQRSGGRLLIFDRQGWQAGRCGPAAAHR